MANFGQIITDGDLLVGVLGNLPKTDFTGTRRIAITPWA